MLTSRASCEWWPQLHAVVLEVAQTETAADGAYQFLGALIQSVVTDDFDSYIARLGPAGPKEISYSEVETARTHA